MPSTKMFRENSNWVEIPLESWSVNFFSFLGRRVKNENLIFNSAHRRKCMSLSGCFLPLTWKWDWRSGFSFHETKRFISGEEVLSEKAGIQNSREFYRGPWPVHVIQIIFRGPWAVHAMQICSGFKSPSTGISGSMCIQTFSQSHFIGTYVRIWPKSHATTIIKSSKVRFFENRSHGISAQRYADK